MGSYDRSRNNNLVILICLSLYSVVVSTNMEGENADNIFNVRPQRFSFGLGKRAGPTAAIKDKRLHELLVRINKWGFSGPHGLFKRSNSVEFGNKSQKRTFWEHLLKGIDEPIFKRDAYSFGLGKRNGQYSFGLGKRGKPAMNMNI